MNVDYLKSRLSYNPNTGEFYSLTNIGSSIIGCVMGTTDADGYTVIKLDMKPYFAHRLAYLYMTGSQAPETIDHENHNKSDNSWDNIKSVSHSKNMKNRGIYKNNSGLYPGIYEQKSGKYWARISVNGDKINLGTFAIYEDAVKAKQDAEVKYGFHINHNK